MSETVRTMEVRLYPNRTQEKAMIQTLEHCCFTYNHLLEVCIGLHDKGEKHPSRFDLGKMVTEFKKEHSELNQVYSQVLQDVRDRLSRAFDGFFRRAKAKEEKAGYPRFRSHTRYDSFTYTQKGFSIEKDRLDLSKIGIMRVAGIRKMRGILKTCTIKRTGNGPHYRWKALLTYRCDDMSTEYIFDDRTPAGIDLGLSEVVVTSENGRYDNERRLAKAEKEIAKIQRQMSKHDKGSPLRNKYKQHLFHRFTRLNNVRKYERHMMVNDLVERHNIIVIEGIPVSKIREKSLGKGMIKSYRDASWAMAVGTLCSKAAEAGCKVVRVNPAYTSQMCSGCGTIVPKDLSVRRHVCPHCGLDIDRDLNAAKNILRLGLQALRPDR